jgi:hypothetical protein
MQAEQFVLWLKGFLEACGDSVNPEQTAVVKENLAALQLRGPFRDRSAVGPTAIAASAKKNAA